QIQSGKIRQTLSIWKALKHIILNQLFLNKI
ncbi:MAG: hypothetical protein ACI9MK_000761, partial [Oceanospirillaceae bacterium]